MEKEMHHCTVCFNDEMDPRFTKAQFLVHITPGSSPMALCLEHTISMFIHYILLPQLKSVKFEITKLEE